MITCEPKPSAASWLVSSHVAITTVSRTSLITHRFQMCQIIGLPLMDFNGLLGNRLEAIRAGMTPKTENSLFKSPLRRPHR